MKWLVRILLALVLLVFGGGAVAIRVARHQAGQPSKVGAELVSVKAGGAYVYGARVGGSVVLFDAGMDDRGRAIDALLASLGAKRDEVTDIFVTHGHIDHIAAIPLFPKAKLHAGAADADLFAGNPRQPMAIVPTLFAPVMPHGPALTISAPLSGRVEIAMGGKTVTCIPMPGHTKGSYAYLFDGMLIVGDTMQFDGTALAPTPRPMNPDPSANLAAIRGLKQELQGVKLDAVCTGHGGCTPPGQGRAALEAFWGRLGA